MDVVFNSGSCRVSLPLTTLHKEGKIELVNPLWDGLCHELPEGVVPHHLGMFHNLEDHYRLYKTLQDDSDHAERFNILDISSPHGSTASFYREDWLEIWGNCKKGFWESVGKIMLYR